MVCLCALQRHSFLGFSKRRWDNLSFVGRSHSEMAGRQREAQWEIFSLLYIIHSLLHCTWSGFFCPTESTLHMVTDNLLTAKSKGHVCHHPDIYSEISDTSITLPYFKLSLLRSQNKSQFWCSFYLKSPYIWRTLLFLPVLPTLCVSRVTTEGLCISFPCVYSELAQWHLCFGY